MNQKTSRLQYTSRMRLLGHKIKLSMQSKYRIESPTNVIKFLCGIHMILVINDVTLNYIL